MVTSNQQKLKDKVAIVTGGGKGIGRAIVLDFAREGARVVTCSRTQRDLEEVALVARNEGPPVLPVKADISSEREVESMVDTAIREFGRVDILVNNASVPGPPGLFTDVTKEEWDEVMSVNLTGVFLCSRAVLRHMIKQGLGNIINVTTSKGWKRMRPGALPYRVSKSGVEGLTIILAKQMKPYGICVNAMGPATTDTDMIRKGIPENVRRKLKMWQPEQVSKLALFLAQQTVDTLTGALIDIQQWDRGLKIE